MRGIYDAYCILNWAPKYVNYGLDSASEPSSTEWGSLVILQVNIDMD